MMRNTTKYKLLDCTMFLFSPKKTQSRIFLKIQTLHTQRKIPLTISQRSMIDNMLVTQSCPTFCDPINCSPLGSSVHGFSRQEYWSGLPFPLPGHLPDRGIEPVSPVLAGTFLITEQPEKPIAQGSKLNIL